MMAMYELLGIDDGEVPAVTPRAQPPPLRSLMH
jgi:hypothetical protein